MGSAGMINLPLGLRKVSSLSPVTRSALSRWADHVQPGQLRAVVFDLGNVVANFYPSAASMTVCAREGWDGSDALKAVEDVLLSPELKEPFEKGKTDFKGFYEGVCERLVLRKTSQGDLERIWNSVFEIRQDTVSLASDLRKAGLLTYILSDTNQQHFQHLSGLLPFLADANGYVLSHQTGFYKCDGPQQFETVISFMRADGLEPNQGMYFDDRFDYTEKAISLGLPALQFLNAADARTLIREVWGTV